MPTNEKQVQMSIKMERALRDEFFEAARQEHRPAAQIVRELMRAFIARKEHRPNATTEAAIEEIEEGRAETARTVDELFGQMGIACEK